MKRCRSGARRHAAPGSSKPTTVPRARLKAVRIAVLRTRVLAVRAVRRPSAAGADRARTRAPGACAGAFPLSSRGFWPAP